MPILGLVGGAFIVVRAFAHTPAQDGLHVVAGLLEDVSYQTSDSFTAPWIEVTLNNSAETFVYHANEPKYDKVQMAFWRPRSGGRRIPVNVELLVSEPRFGRADIWQVKRDDQTVVSYQDVYDYIEGRRRRDIPLNLLFASAMFLWSAFGIREAFRSAA
jgi:hypothetical protein